MKKRKKLFSVLFLLLVALLAYSIASFANTDSSMTQDGIKATLTTDKDTYSVGDTVKVTVKIENTNSYAVNNVTYKATLPEGLVASSDTVLEKAFSSMVAGATETIIVNTTAVKEGEVKTGDTTPVVLFILLAICAVMAMFFMFKMNKKASNSLMVAIVVTVATVMAFGTYAEASTTTKQITLEKKVKVGDNDSVIKAVVKYEFEEETTAASSSSDNSNGNTSNDTAETTTAGSTVETTTVASTETTTGTTTETTADSGDNDDSTAVFAHVSVHDPSIVRSEDGKYYVFGSHLAAAQSTNLITWNKIADGVVTTNPLFNNYKSELSEPLAWLNGQPDTVWAGDVIYNKAMGKYCYYACSSVWGTSQSVIWFATSDNIAGPYDYQASIIYTGFNNSTNSSNPLSYKNTNIDELIANGTLSGLRSGWFFSNGSYNNAIGMFPNAIDPTVFYDNSGKLWMVYGSYSGGIYVIQLDNTTGKPLYKGSETGGYDRYFGKLICKSASDGTGEGPFIMYDKTSGYYFLYVTYGGLAENDGYNIRVYRSLSPDGPYTDAAGNLAASNTNYGTKLFGNYKFSSQSVAYKSGGHSSAFVDANGKMFQVYHTRFDDGDTVDAHEVRVHQMFLNKNGWTVLAPYEYSGETISSTGYDASEIVGEYEFMNHGTSTTNTISLPSKIYLNVDGTITGACSGTWVSEEGTYYATLVIDGITYDGVFLKQSDETVNRTVVMTFTAISGTNNTAIWGSKISNNVDTSVTLTYDFEENLLDSNGANGGTAVGDISYVTGIDGGKAINFTGASVASGYITLPTSIVGDSFTVSAFVKPTQITTYASCFFMDYGSKGFMSVYPKAWDTVLDFRYRVEANDTWNDTNYSTTLSAGQWYNIAVTYDASSKTAKLYLNGNLVSTGNNITSLGIPSTIKVGTDNWVAFNGAVDKLLISNSAKSSSELAAYYNQNN